MGSGSSHGSFPNITETQPRLPTAPLGLSLRDGWRLELLCQASRRVTAFTLAVSVHLPAHTSTDTPPAPGSWSCVQGNDSGRASSYLKRQHLSLRAKSVGTHIQSHLR